MDDGLARTAEAGCYDRRALRTVADPLAGRLQLPLTRPLENHAAHAAPRPQAAVGRIHDGVRRNVQNSLLLDCN